MKPFAPIQIHASPFLGRFTLSSMKMKPFSPIQSHTSPFLGWFTLSIYENEAFCSYTNPCISHFWDGLLSLYMKMKPFSPIQMHISPTFGEVYPL